MPQLNPGSYVPQAAITPSDTTEITCRAIYVGGAGNVAVRQKGGAAVTLTAPPVGSVLPLALDQGQVMATGTTATLLVALG